MAPRAAALSLALAAAAAAPATYSNPLSRADAPDPGVAFDAASGLYFSGTTTGGAPCFALRSSPDLATGTDLGFAFADQVGGIDPWNLHPKNGTLRWEHPNPPARRSDAP